MQQLIPGDDLSSNDLLGLVAGRESEAGQILTLLDPLNVGKEDF